MNKKTGRRIDPETMGIIAEHGIGKIHLSKEQIAWLNAEGYEELQLLKKMKSAGEYEPLPSKLHNTALEKFFPFQQDAKTENVPLHIKCINGILELIESPKAWAAGSPAFSYRSVDTIHKPLTFKHVTQKGTAHIELQSRHDDTTDISVRCNDCSGNPLPCIEVELLRSGRCIESVSSSDPGPVTIKSVKKGSMQLCIHTDQGPEIKLDIRVD